MTYDWEAALEANQRAESQAQIDAIAPALRAGLRPHHRERVFTLSPPVAIERRGEGHFRLTRIKVTEYANDEQGWDQHIEGLMHPLTAKGEPHKNASPVWRLLPDALLAMIPREES